MSYLPGNKVFTIKTLLEKKGLIKIKLLRSFTESTNRKTIATKIAQDLNATLISQIGLTLVLYKPIKKQTNMKSYRV